MKKSIEVDREKFVKALRKAEEKGPLANRSALWEAIANIYNLDIVPVKISPSIAMLRVTGWGLEVKTPVGKRGRAKLSPEQKAAMQVARGKRVPRGEKFKQIPEIVQGFTELRSELTKEFKQYLPVLEKSVEGSAKAGIKLKCLECTSYQPMEIKHCNINTCGLFPYRPYQNNSSEETVEEDLGCKQ